MALDEDELTAQNALANRITIEEGTGAAPELPDEPVMPVPVGDGRLVGTAFVRLALRDGDRDVPLPTLKRLETVIEDAIFGELGFTAAARAEWTDR